MKCMLTAAIGKKKKNVYPLVTRPVNFNNKYIFCSLSHVPCTRMFKFSSIFSAVCHVRSCTVMQKQIFFMSDFLGVCFELVFYGCTKSDSTMKNLWLLHVRENQLEAHLAGPKTLCHHLPSWQGLQTFSFCESSCRPILITSYDLIQ